MGPLRATSPRHTGKGRNRIRLDQLLVERSLAPSRQQARALILAGRVLVEGVRQDKPGTRVAPGAEVRLQGEAMPYVSRGGLKLEAAIAAFRLDLRDKVALDVGASTGGFTHCLLSHGARRVYALDVGYGQLHWRLRKDPRVVVMERTHIGRLPPESFPEPVDVVTVDVSFISLEKVLPAVARLLKRGGTGVFLIKPQFEVGKREVGKGGVVRDPEKHRRVVARLQSVAVSLGFHVRGVIPSPLLGPKGNQEFLMVAEYTGGAEGSPS